MKKVKSKKNTFPIDRLVVFIFFTFVSLIYIHNITRDVYSGDIGDLVTAAYFMGVAHPPGYPLFTFFGFLFSHLPVPLPIVSKIALLSSLASLVALYIYYRFSKFVTSDIFISLLSTSILGFSYLFWLHAEIPEVFGLNSLFIVTILVTAFLFYKTGERKFLFIFSFLIGLSLTHHHTILLLFPAAGLLLLKRFKQLFFNKKNLFLSLLLSLLGISFYLYVPIASSQNPVINWDNVTDLKSFIHLIQRKDYGGFAPRIDNEVPISVKLIIVQDYFKTIVSIFSFQIIFVSLAGLYYLLKKDRYFLMCLLVGYLISGPFFVYYAATLITTTTALGIIERFYTMSTIVFMFSVPFGFMFLKQFIDKRFSNKLYGYALIGYFLIVPVLLFQYNFPKTNLSTSTFGIQLVKDILSQISINGILYVSGDTTTFNTWYTHYVLKERTDIGLINPPGVGGNVFLNEAINNYYQKNKKIKIGDVLHSTIEDLRKKRTIYSTYEMEYRPSDSLLVPKGLVYELIYKNNIPTEKKYIETVNLQLRELHITKKNDLLPNQRNLVAAEIPLIYSNAHVRIGDFITNYYKNPKLAQQYYKKAIEIDNENPSGYAGYGLSLYKGENNCSDAIENMEKAIAYYPIWKTYYAQLYVLHKKCQSDNNILQNFTNNYKLIFNKNIENDLPQGFQAELENKPTDET